MGALLELADIQNAHSTINSSADESWNKISELLTPQAKNLFKWGEGHGHSFLLNKKGKTLMEALQNTLEETLDTEREVHDHGELHSTLPQEYRLLNSPRDPTD